MKHVLSLSALLLTTALYISSCNPIDEDELNSSTSSNSPNLQQMSPQEVFDAIQGEWYCYRRTSVDGPTCAGGSNESKKMDTFDLNYAGYKVTFTSNPTEVGLLIADLPCYEFYYDGGGGTSFYYISTFSENQQDLEALDMVVNSDLLIQEGGVYLHGMSGIIAGHTINFPYASKILQLDQENLIIYDPILQYQYYFKRSNATVSPHNEQGLQGTFLWDNYKEVTSGVEVENIALNGDISYTFTDEITYNQQSKVIHYKGQRTGPVNSGWFPNFEENELQFSYFNDGEQVFFEFETSTTHLSAWTGSGTSVNIHQLNNIELILRVGGCNSYKEYHFTKIN
jgi:hypothetical protein